MSLYLIMVDIHSISLCIEESVQIREEFLRNLHEQGILDIIFSY